MNKRYLLLATMAFLYSINLFGQSYELWGFHESDGEKGGGNIFRLDLNNQNPEVVFDFESEKYLRKGRLCESPNGKLYGLMSQTQSGVIEIFEYDTATNEINTVFKSNGGVLGSFLTYFPTIDRNGVMYGLLKNGGTYGEGVLYKFNTLDYQYTVLYNFDSSGIHTPRGGLLLASNGKLYGFTWKGGGYNAGGIFEIDTSGNSFNELYYFEDNLIQPYSPRGNLIEVFPGKLYGLTSYGGNWDVGTLYELDLSTQVFTTLIEFDELETGARPTGSLVHASNGKLYGTTKKGGIHDDGVLFEYDPVTKEFVKKIDFKEDSIGYNSDGSLEIFSDQILIGTTKYGGDYGNQFESKYIGGTLYEYNILSNELTKVIDFDDSLGHVPLQYLTVTSNKKVYGFTETGGNHNSGTFFQYKPEANTLEKKIDFLYSPNGSKPAGDLILGNENLIYGTTRSGGEFGFGTLFSISSETNELLILHDFDGKDGGGEATSPMLLASNNNLYGVTKLGGERNLGVLFEYNIASKQYIKLFDFDGENFGSTPDDCGLIEIEEGKIIGFAGYGGIFNYGAIFEYDILEGNMTKLDDFDLTNNGWFPTKQIGKTNSGRYFGITGRGGIYNDGTIYEYNPMTKSISKLYDFDENASFGYPNSTLVQTSNGEIYGTTSSGGALDYGVLYRFDPEANDCVAEVNFDNDSLGGIPHHKLIQLNDKLYGVTKQSPTAGIGDIFEYDLDTKIVTRIIDLGSGLKPRISFSKRKWYVQSISFDTIYNVSYADSLIELVEFSSADLPISYHIEDSTIGEISDNSIIVKGVGETSIIATQEGNEDYYPADTVIGELVVEKAPLVVSADNKELVYGESTPDLTMSYNGFVKGDSIDDIEEPSISTVANADSNAGEYNITLTEGAADNYELSLIDGVLSIIKAPQSITFELQESALLNNEQSIELVATASSDLQVAFSSSDENVAQVNGSTLDLIIPGQVTVTASQEGNQNYIEAEPQSRILTVEQILGLIDELPKASIYPNPASHYFSIQDDARTVDIYNVKGELVKSFVDISDQFEISELSNGTYLLIVQDGVQTKYARLIIHR